MTMADLEQLLREHVPDSAVCIQERGRAGVTKHVERNARYDNLESMPALRTAAPAPQAFWWYYDHERICPVCDKKFDRKGSRRRYCSDACQQKAYRQRKKQKAA